MPDEPALVQRPPGELPKSKLQAYRENFSKVRRYRKKAKTELARRKTGP